jgi:hypothetical protein
VILQAFAPSKCTTAATAAARVGESHHNGLPPREAIVELLDFLSSASVSRRDRAALTQLQHLPILLAEMLMRPMGLGGLDDCERVALIYCLVLLLAGSAFALDEVVVSAVTPVLVTTALCGLVRWEHAGWLDEIVSGSPMQQAAANAQCHAAMVQEIDHTRERAARLARLLGMPPEKLAELHPTSGGLHLSDDYKDTIGCNSNGSLGISSIDAPPSLAGSRAGGSVVAGGASDESVLRGMNDDRDLKRRNMFSPSALRHTASVGLGFLYQHGRTQRGLKGCFVSGGGLDALLLLGYYTFPEHLVEVTGEGEAVVQGMVNYEHHDQKSWEKENAGDILRFEHMLQRSEVINPGGVGKAPLARGGVRHLPQGGGGDTCGGSRSEMNSLMVEAAFLKGSGYAGYDVEGMPISVSLADQARSELHSSPLVETAGVIARATSPDARQAKAPRTSKTGGVGPMLATQPPNFGHVGRDGVVLGAAAAARRSGIAFSGRGEETVAERATARVRSSSVIGKGDGGGAGSGLVPQSLAECRRTARLAESVLSQLDAADLVQLQCLRAAAVRGATQCPLRGRRSTEKDRTEAKGNRDEPTASHRLGVNSRSGLRGGPRRPAGQRSPSSERLRLEPPAAALLNTLPSRALRRTNSKALARCLKLPDLPPEQWLHPLKLLERCADRPRILSSGIPKNPQQHQQTEQFNSTGDGFRNKNVKIKHPSILSQLQTPHCALFHLVTAPLADALRERAAAARAYQGSHLAGDEPKEVGGSTSVDPAGLNGFGAGGGDRVSRVLRTDALRAQSRAENRGLPVTERLAAAAVGARMEDTAARRGRQVASQRAIERMAATAQQQALAGVDDTEGGGGGSTYLPGMGRGGGCNVGGSALTNPELARRLATQLADFAVEQMAADERRNQSRRYRLRDQKEDDDESSLESEEDEENVMDVYKKASDARSAAATNKKNSGGSGGDGKQKQNEVAEEETQEGHGAKKQEKMSGEEWAEQQERGSEARRGVSSKKGKKSKKKRVVKDLVVVTVEDLGRNPDILQELAMDSAREGRMETEIERRRRTAAKRRYELMNRGEIEEARERIEVDRVGLLLEDKRSAKLELETRKEEATAFAQREGARHQELTELVLQAADAARRTQNEENDRVRKMYTVLKQERAMEVFEANKARKKRAAAEKTRIGNIRADVEKERVDRENFLRLEAWMEEERARKKKEQRAFEATVATYRISRDLHDRRGAIFVGKAEARGRLTRGVFKIIDGVLKWRDGEDPSKMSHLEQNDPRLRVAESAFLKGILTIGPVKPWTWSEAERPALPKKDEVSSPPIRALGATADVNHGSSGEPPKAEADKAGTGGSVDGGGDDDDDDDEAATERGGLS